MLGIASLLVAGRNTAHKPEGDRLLIGNLQKSRKICAGRPLIDTGTVRPYLTAVITLGPGSGSGRGAFLPGCLVSRRYPNWLPCQIRYH
jgi:hypothetical protein